MPNLCARSPILKFLPGLAIGALSIGLAAQQSEPQVPGPTIRVNTRLVLVDVVVTDKQCHTVSGLKADDFAVEENRKKHKISTFVALKMQPQRARFQAWRPACTQIVRISGPMEGRSPSFPIGCRECSVPGPVLRPV